MRVYLAAPYPMRDAAINLMQVLEAAGLEITSRWLRHEDPLTDFHAKQDLEDVARAELLVVLNPEEWANTGTGGRHVELGYALALGKPIILVGVRSNIFHYLDAVEVQQIDELAPLLQPTSLLVRRLIAGIAADL